MVPPPIHPSPANSPAQGEGPRGESPVESDRDGEGERRRRPFPAIGASVLAAVLLSFVFWQPLWTGGGLVGSDIYAYFLPQKAYFADSLRAGVLPYWNNLVGHGYPQVAESQTGVFYPPHWLLYPLLSLNAAFSASIVAHYVLAFLFTCLYARRIGLSHLGAGLAALVYTYGWFPPRVCLEWSIIGGAWFPLALWCAESFLQTRFWRFAILLTLVLAVQMLAGHFILAFITQVTLLLYVPMRLWPTRLWCMAGDLPQGTRSSRWATGGGLALAVAAAFFVAAVQLLPTWELKNLSQRQSVTDEHDPGYGYIPPLYLTQTACPWLWYPDESSFSLATTPGGSRTNRVEAHLYFGLIPLALMLWGTWKSKAWQFKKTPDPRLAIWMILGMAALLYTTGCLLPVTKHLPGFSFFEGPGRFGVVTTFAAGLLAGVGFADVYRQCPTIARRLLSAVAPFVARMFSPRMAVAVRVLFVVAVFSGTVADLFVVSRQVTFAVLVQDPPANHLAESPLRRYFSERPQPARIFSEAKNLPTLLGVATVPTYLGLGPAQYYDPAFSLPNPLPYATGPTAEQLAWFHRAGVTHFLSFVPADERALSGRLVWHGVDPFLNRALGRHRDEEFYLLELSGGRGRVAWDRSAASQSGDRAQSAEAARSAVASQSAAVTQYRPNRVVIGADSTDGGILVLTDLAYPGWEVSVDGTPREPKIVDGMFRGVELSSGKHTIIWTYRPTDVYWGAGISLGMVLILMAIAHVRYWRPHRFERKWPFNPKPTQTG